jgi:hypothetical protein
VGLLLKGVYFKLKKSAEGAPNSSLGQRPRKYGYIKIRGLKA